MSCAPGFKTLPNELAVDFDQAPNTHAKLDQAEGHVHHLELLVAVNGERQSQQHENRIGEENRQEPSFRHHRSQAQAAIADKEEDATEKKHGAPGTREGMGTGGNNDHRVQ